MPRKPAHSGICITSPTQPRRPAARRLLSFEHALATDNLTSLIQAETPRSQLAGVAIVLKIASHISLFSSGPHGTALMAKYGIGAAVLRKEDDRFLHGRGQYVADFRLAGTREVAFVRSPVAHARL